MQACVRRAGGGSVPAKRMIAAGAYIATRCQAMTPPTAAEATPQATSVGEARAISSVITNQAMAPMIVAAAKPDSGGAARASSRAGASA